MYVPAAAIANSGTHVAAMVRLQMIATRLVQNGDRNDLLDEILCAAADLTGTDKGNIQLYDADSKQLRVIVHQGLGQRFVEHFAHKGWAPTCERAAESRTRVVLEDIDSLSEFCDSDGLTVVREDGIRAMQSTPLLSRDGSRLIGMLNNHYREPHGPSDLECHYLDLLARLAADFIERVEAEEALAAELRASQSLHEIAARMVQATDYPKFLEEILDAAIAITGADMGSIQVANEGVLRLVANRGFNALCLEFFDEVTDESCACGSALATGESVFISNIVDSPLLSPETRAILLSSNVRAVISIPLIGRSGAPVGMFSTHYREPQRPPNQQTLHKLDLLARLAAGLLESRNDERRLRDADRRKDIFMAVLSHEVRGPLCAITNALEVLNRRPHDPAVSCWAREVMQRQLSQLTRLTDDLMDLSRISQGKIELNRQSVALQPIIEEAVEACRPLLVARQHSLQLSVPSEAIYVPGDSARLVQVFVNLMSNACKYTAPRGEIRIVVKRTDSEAVIRMQDSGKGISSDSLHSIFEIFSQAQPLTNQKDSGLGIGLYLVKRLVEMHGGTVMVSSAGLGHGSEFVVRLPTLRERRGAERAPSGLMASPPPGSRAELG